MAGGCWYVWAFQGGGHHPLQPGPSGIFTWLGSVGVPSGLGPPVF